MDLDQTGFDPSKPSIHNNVVRKLPLPKYGLMSRGTFGIEESCTIVVNEEACSAFSCLTSRGGRRLRCNSIDGSGLTPSNMIENLMECKEKMSKNPLTLIMDTNKFTGTNYNDWLLNLRSVLDFENQGYVLDKLLPTALLEGSSPEERMTFENGLRTTARYAAIKAFSVTKMAKGSSIQSHGIKMLSLVEKLENLKAGLDHDTYIDMILQSLCPSYDSFIINYNINGLRKSIHELINILVQYEVTTHKSMPTILVGDASTSKAKGKRVGGWKRKKGNGKFVRATTSAESAPAASMGKGKGKQKVVERSRRLSKDEMILRLGDGKPASYKYLRVWGSLANVKRLMGDKLDSRSNQCRFVGNSKEIVGYYFYDPSEQKIFVSKNTVFLEKDFPTDSRWDEVLLDESSETPQQNDATSS
ncbi:hypothetical protein Sango_0365200 [Sesamum angolense]|uniref:Retroviral polymerase SH3-like domain-containing protein n=1 Tax=Sesamum angolense TaxID=2727404 RepID=A0AAE1X9L5_9LAMI|nr:hypothetical protein Sango_0365200 [Sesamum angolense]